MSFGNKTHVPYRGTALPGNAEVITLFNSVLSFALNAAPHMQVNWVDIAIRFDQNANNTVALQKSTDGTNWTTVETRTISNLGDGSDPNALSFFVGVYSNFRIIYTNGATPQTVFAVDLSLADERTPNR